MQREMLVQNVQRSQIAKILIRDKSFVCLLLVSAKFRCVCVCLYMCACIAVASLAYFFFFALQLVLNGVDFH